MVWGRKFYLGTAEIASFSSRDWSRSNMNDTIWHNVSTGYFYVLFFWAIVLDFLPLEIYKHLVLPLSSITFTANSQADNHFYKYIYWFQILHSMKSVFYLKCTLKCFIFKFDLNAKYRPYFFYRKTSS